MGKQASQRVARIVYKQEPRKVIHTVPEATESKSVCRPRNATILTVQTICPERNGSAQARRVGDE